MSLQSGFFGKRNANTPMASPLHRSPGTLSGASASSLAQAPLATPLMQTQTTLAAAELPPASAPASPRLSAPSKEGGSKLTVGPNIKLKGVEITDCDTLVVEGTVEATMDSRVMHITEIGVFKGSAEIDYAEIHGEFSGDLLVRDKLVIYSTGRVSGKIRYGKVVIEEGGQLMGDIQFGKTLDATGLPPGKMGLISAG